MGVKHFRRRRNRLLEWMYLMTPKSSTLEPQTSLPSAETARKKIGFVSLGCPKNLVDSEVMMGLLAQAGAEITPNAEDAEVIVVNTCSFIESAQQESVNTILEMAQHPATTSFFAMRSGRTFRKWTRWWEPESWSTFSRLRG